MDIWMAFAYISDGEVKNVACYLYTGYAEADVHAKSYCSDEEAFAVDVTHIPVMQGDKYINGTFYRGDEEITPLPTVEQQTMANTEDIERNEAQTYYTAVMTDTLIEEE